MTGNKLALEYRERRCLEKMSISSVSKRFLDSTTDGNWTSNQTPKLIEDLHAFIVRLMN